MSRPPSIILGGEAKPYASPPIAIVKMLKRAKKREAAKPLTRRRKTP